MTRSLGLATALVAATLGTSALAAAPPILPLQGTLHDAAGEPIDGTLQVRFSIYAAEGAADPLWTETQAVSFTQGLFTAPLGSNVPVPLELFDEYADLWLGVRVDTDSEMPRVPLGTVPWAAWAEYAGDARTLQGATLDDISTSARSEGDARWAPLGHATPWETVTGVPEALADGDGDLLATLLCASGQILRVGALGWQCDDDIDSFETFLCDEGQIARWAGGGWTCSADVDTDTNTDLLATISGCTAGQTLKWDGATWACADDIDTDTDTNTDLLASISGCTTGQTLKWTGAAWACANDIDTDTNTDVLAALACGSGQIPRWSGAAWSCSNDVDTNTDTRCDAPGTCAQVCIGARCSTRIPGSPRVEPLSGSFSASAQWTVPAVDGTPLSVTVSLYTYGGSNRMGAVDARWIDAGGVEIRSWTQISGTNVNNGGDGGSGMADRELATIPIFTGTARIEFRQSGLNAYSGEYVAFTWIP